jgi:type I restriction enzyme S subunit
MKSAVTKVTEVETLEMAADDLPEGWTLVHLEALVDILDSLRVPVNHKERERRGGQIPYYGATGQVGWIDDYLFDEELILLGEDGAPFLDKSKPIAYVIRGKSWVNNHAHVLRAVAGLTCASYVKHYLEIFDFSDYVTGTTRLKLTQEAMRSIPVALAPAPEQKRIVTKIEELLKHVNASRDHLAKITKILTAFRQSVLAAACSGRLTEDWREQNPVSLTQVADETNYDDLPIGWKSIRVGDVIENLRYGTAQKCSYEKRGVPVLRIPNVANGTIDHTDLKYAELTNQELKTLRLCPGDILIIRSNGSVSLVGKCALVQERDQGFAYAGYLIRIRPKKTAVVPEFLNLVFSSYDMRLQIEFKARSTSGVNNINGDEVRALRFWLPPPVEQHEIVRRVENLFKLADSIEKRVALATKRAAKLTQSVLAKAFRAELVPTEAELARREGRTYERASALLERIKAERERMGIVHNVAERPRARARAVRRTR